MGDKTSIQWTDASWNPLRGCSRVSEGCRHCYAETVAARFSGPGQPYEGLATRSPARWTGKVVLVEEHLRDPLRWQKPRRIFVNSMSDLFHESVPDEWIDRVFAVMALSRRHTFQVLTKRPERMRDYIAKRSRSAQPWKDAARTVGYSLEFAPTDMTPISLVPFPLPNVWLGTSVEDVATLGRLNLLRETLTAVRFVSFEPLLECLGDVDLTGIAWAIYGGESGAGARPMNVAWVRRGLLRCRKYGTAAFVKQLGARPFELVVGALAARENKARVVELNLSDAKGGDMAEWSEDLRVREFPQAARA